MEELEGKKVCQDAVAVAVVRRFVNVEIGESHVRTL